MGEIGYNMSGHVSKSLADLPPTYYDYVITMGCQDACPFVHAVQRDDWGIPDPKEMEKEAFRQVRDLIEIKVLELISKCA